MSQTKAQLLEGKSATVEFTNGSASAPAVSFTGDTNTGIYSPGADQLALSTNGTGRLFINAAGQVSAGGATLAATQSVFGIKQAANNTKYRGLTIENSADDSQISIAFDGTSDTFSISPSYGTTGAFKPISFWTSNTERLRITSAGLVGIGTSSPQQVLHLASTAATTLVQFNDSGSGGTAAQCRIGCVGNDFVVLNNTGSNPATTRLRITSGGNVGIGTSSPGAPLDVIAPRGNLVRFQESGSPFNGLVFSTDSTGATIKSNSGTGYLAFNTGNSESARIDSSGRLLVGTSSATGNAKIEIKGGTLSTTEAVNKGGMLRLQSGGTSMSTSSSITIADYFSIAPRRVIGVVYATTVDTSGHRARSWKVYGKIGSLSIVDDVNDSSSGGGSTPNLTLSESSSGVLTITPSWAFGGTGYIWSVDLLVGCAVS